ncbi:MAG TPA: ATPase, T2SS/T4P/T4SS family, partial [Phycisphaerae bacterium]|nr:ATPase, T2SS/T4P/T4SS family [Phycisphaerae bacterium]
MPVLQILTPTGHQVVTLPDGNVTIGRSRDNDVVIDDPRGSRNHCILRPIVGGYTLTDLGSRNGTRYNGQLVTEATIRFGDSFMIGKTLLRIFEKQAPPVELEDLSETQDAEAIEAPVARLIEPDDEEEPELPGRYVASVPSAEPLTLEQVTANARRDLMRLRSAGTDPGFGIESITFLDCHGKPVHGGDRADTSSEAVRTLRLLMYGAFRTRATDIHLHPSVQGFQVRFRVDGRMLPIVLLPESIGRSVLTVVKVLAELNIARREAIQEGSFAVSVPRQVDCRVAFSPTSHGENLVCRILDTAVIPNTIEDLGLSSTMLRQFRAACNCDSGMIVVSGPTGSGKTTTLYTALRSIDCRTRNVITIEDPIEYHLAGITQIQTDEKRNLTFGTVLKSILRQDPDVILVGEMRDAETARTAMQAAMTGHLVFSTLHARDAIGSIFRLLDLGIEPYMIANAASICLAQRLIRTLCEHCKKPYQPKPSQLVRMKMQDRGIDVLYTNVGCRRCMDVGFRGRQAIFEMLAFNDNLRDALMTT